MKQIFLLYFLLLLVSPGRAQLTRFESSGGKETATYAEVVAWYRMLGKASPKLMVKDMGPTDAGYPLQLVLISNDNSFDPEKWHRQKKLVILVNNGIHPGEPDGIDASMMLARDITIGKIKLPANVALGFIPVYNIGGALNRNSTTRVNQNGPLEYGFRGNAQNLDLNRDFIKSDSREAASFARVFHLLDPDIFIDNHVSDGADYQHTMTLITTQYEKLGNISGPWLKNNFEPAIYSNMARKGWDLVPYVDFESADLEKGMTMFYDPPRYSSGYAALFHTFSFVPETHMLKPYPERVKSTYDLMLAFIEEGAKNAASLLEQRKRARDFTRIQQQQFPLKWIPDPTKHQEILFKGYEKDSAISVATGLMKMFYNHQRPFTRNIPFFNSYKPVDLIAKPRAYIIPQGWHTVIDRMQINGVKLHTLTSDTTIGVNAYRIESFKSLPAPYEKHHKNYNVKVNLSRQEQRFLKGDRLVYLNQAGNRYIIEMLEPRSEDGFFAWNFFDAILQQKEGYSDYRWEELAAVVLRQDPTLRQKLEEKKRSDTAFAASSHAILDFIYRNSEHYEKAHLQYPVYRIEY